MAAVVEHRVVEVVDLVKMDPMVEEVVMVDPVHMTQIMQLLDLMDGCTVEMDMLIFSTQLQ